MPLSRRDVWAERMARYDACSLTVRDFCQQDGVSQASFYYWKRKLADNGRRAQVGRIETDRTQSGMTPPPKFVAIGLSDVTGTAATTTIRLPGGASIDVDPRTSQHDLEKLITAVVAATQAGLNATACESGNSHGGLA